MATVLHIEIKLAIYSCINAKSLLHFLAYRKVCTVQEKDTPSYSSTNVLAPILRVGAALGVNK